jgi:Protein of unknown function (DUF4232)
MRSLGLPVVALVLLSLDGSRSLAQASGSAVKVCSTGQLSLDLDDEGGNFAGMSHSGTLLVLRNLGPEVCSVPARAAVGFEDAQQHPIHVTLESPVEMHPGPVLMPVAVPVGAELTTELRWVLGDVYDGHNCVSPAFLTVTVGTDVMRVEFTRRTLCGPAGKPVSYSMTPLRRDPVYTAP